MAKTSNVDPKLLQGYYAQLNQELEQQASNLRGINSEEDRRRIVAEQISNNEKVINELQKQYLAGNTTLKDDLDNIRRKQKDLIDGEKDLNRQLQDGIKARKKQLDLVKSFGEQLKIGWKYLQDQDKIIKSTILSLGMSGAKAVLMRDAFEKSAGYVTRLGGTIGDIQSVMQGYADETGRARVMTADMVKDITAIGKGTELGIEQATKLGAQFELMGFNAKTTMDYVQGVVDTSERMGVNTTKVLKNVNDNFKKLNTYTFQQGVKGFAQMAMYAEKFKIDIGQALNAADVARKLEGAIDLAAQLQVMGGEFAKTDPFEMLFLSRNDPAKFTEKIADMTKGVVSFRKMADGTFEKFISPADRDRLAAVAKSMGMEAGALTEIAERQAEIQKMRQQTAGMGLSKQQQELIEGAAIFDKKSGKFQVQLAGTMRDISTLTSDQADSFVKEKISLEERAKQAMTFDETFKATIEILKSALLPILKGVNQLLKPLSWIADQFSKLAGSGWGGVVSAAAILLAGAAAWKVTGTLMSRAADKWIQSGKMFGGQGKMGSLLSGVNPASPATGKGSSGLAQMRAGQGAGAAAKGKGFKTMGTGAGIGMAAVGLGAGVGLAAEGISKLADSMSKLTKEQAENLKSIATTLAVTFPLAAIGIGIVAAVAAPAAGPLLALGAALLMIGGAVGIAAAGIGYMGKGLGEMFKKTKGGGKEMSEIAVGMTKMAGAMSLFTIGGLGLPVFLATMGAITTASLSSAKMASNLEKMGTAMKGTKDDWIAVQNAITAISGSNTRGSGVIADLANLMKQPLKVEFANGQKVSLTNDITLNLDGQKFMQKTYDVNIAVQKHESLKHGKGA